MESGNLPLQIQVDIDIAHRTDYNLPHFRSEKRDESSRNMAGNRLVYRQAAVSEVSRLHDQCFGL